MEKPHKKNMKAMFLFGFLAMVSVQAEYELRYYEPRRPVQQPMPSKTQPKTALGDKRVVLQTVRGLIIAPEGDRPGNYVLQTTKGVQVYRTMKSIPAKKREQLQKELERFIIGKALTLEKIEELKLKISKFYQNNGHALVIVNVPEQDVTDGVVVVTVLEARLGKVVVSGNKWFSNEWYLQKVSLQEDEVIETGLVDQDVAWINNSPWRKATVIYKPGESYGTTDVELYVNDARPLRIFAGADNTGFKFSDYSRVFFGINWGNLFYSDQTLAYQYIASPDFKKFQAHLLQYTAPLAWRDEIVLMGGCSFIKVNKGVYATDTRTNKSELLTGKNHGRDWQVSGHYGFFIPPQGQLFQKANAGFDWKETNNSLTVFEQPTEISKSDVIIFQLKGNYQLSYSFGNSVAEFQADGFVQPWHLGNSMSEKAYSQLRSGADREYIYGRFKGSYVWTDPKSKFGVSVKGRVQLSSGALIPLEMFGVGGVSTVRGYVERAVNVDNGGILNIEVKSPSVSVFKGKIDDGISALVFLDMGGGSLNTHLEGEPASYFLAGIGPGLRYDFSNWIRARLDVGVRLTDNPFSSPSDARARVYFSVMGSY